MQAMATEKSWLRLDVGVVTDAGRVGMEEVAIKARRSDGSEREELRCSQMRT